MQLVKHLVRITAYALQAFAFASVSAQASGTAKLRVSHLQHLYAGGGACVERFWVEAIGFDTEITDVQVSFEVVSRQGPLQKGNFRIGRLGNHVNDSETEASSEIAGCPVGNAAIKITSANATVSGQAFDLLRKKRVEFGTVQRLRLHL